MNFISSGFYLKYYKFGILIQIRSDSLRILTTILWVSVEVVSEKNRTIPLNFQTW